MELAAGKVAAVERHNRGIAGRHGQFQHMIVPFIAQVRSPSVINLDELGARQDGIEQVSLRRARQGAAALRVGTRQHGFIFREQWNRQQRDGLALQHSAQCRTRGTLPARKSRHQHIAVENNPSHTHFLMIAYMLSPRIRGISTESEALQAVDDLRAKLIAWNLRVEGLLTVMLITVDRKTTG